MREFVSMDQPGVALASDIEALIAYAADIAVATDSSAEECVHETRKLLKRARAYLRLLPTALQPELNGRLRKIQKDLGAVRDITAVWEALERLLESGKGDEVERSTLERLLGEAPAIHREAVAPVLIAASQGLRALAKEVPRNDVADFAAIAKGLRRVAKRSRRAMRKAQCSTEPEDFHAWRRRLKDYALCLRYVASLHEELLERERSIADEVARTLGEEHDLELVRGVASRVELDPSTYAKFGRFLGKTQAQARHAALELGLLIHAETPRAFAARIEAYFDARVQCDR